MKSEKKRAPLGEESERARARSSPKNGRRENASAPLSHHNLLPLRRHARQAEELALEDGGRLGRVDVHLVRLLAPLDGDLLRESEGEREEREGERVERWCVCGQRGRASE